MKNLFTSGKMRAIVCMIGLIFVLCAFTTSEVRYSDTHYRTVLNCIESGAMEIDFYADNQIDVYLTNVSAFPVGVYLRCHIRSGEDIDVVLLPQQTTEIKRYAVDETELPMRWPFYLAAGTMDPKKHKVVVGFDADWGF